jgi:6-phosphofructokinase 2
MIATITINPAVDKSTTLDKLIPEKKLRCSDLRIEAGGGGINVSKAIEKLGGKSLAMFPSGGANGKLLEKILLENKIPFKSIPVENETRESFTATELSTNAQYRFVMPGGNLNSTELDFCLTAITELNPLPSIIIGSGSLPPGVPDDFFARLAVISKKRGVKLIVDTSGKPLHLAAQEGVYLLKPNLSELCSLVNKDYLQMSEVDEAAKQVIRNGHCEVMVVSMGPAGAMLVTKEIHEKIPAPTVKKLSTVGAGDSMVGGMAWMLEQGKPLLEIVRFGVACGTAATMNAGTQLFKKEDVYRLYEWINQHSISFVAA